MKTADQISQIIDSVDIIDIANSYRLIDKNEDLTACFGGHEDSPNTLRFDADTQTYYCVDSQCRLHGNVVDLVQVMENDLPFLDAVNHIANQIGIDPILASEELQQYLQYANAFKPQRDSMLATWTMPYRTWTGGVFPDRPRNATS